MQPCRCGESCICGFFKIRRVSSLHSRLLHLQLTISFLITVADSDNHAASLGTRISLTQTASGCCPRITMSSANIGSNIAFALDLPLISLHWPAIFGYCIHNTRLTRMCFWKLRCAWEMMPGLDSLPIAFTSGIAANPPLDIQTKGDGLCHWSSYSASSSASGYPSTHLHLV